MASLYWINPKVCANVGNLCCVSMTLLCHDIELHLHYCPFLAKSTGKLLHNWPFVRGIHWSQKDPIIQSLDVSLLLVWTRSGTNSLITCDFRPHDIHVMHCRELCVLFMFNFWPCSVVYGIFIYIWYSQLEHKFKYKFSNIDILITKLLHNYCQIHYLPRMEYISGLNPSFGMWVVFSFHYLSSIDYARYGAVIWMTWETSIHSPYTHEPPNSSAADSYRVGLRNIKSHLGLESPVMRQEENEYLRSTSVGIISTSMCFIISGFSCVKWRCEI